MASTIDNRGQDMVRKQEHPAPMASCDEALKGTKCLWLYNWESVGGTAR
jgi:hypothetical protein